MTTKELIEYLQSFNPDEPVGILALDLKTRKAYNAGAYQLMTDAGFPVILLELDDSKTLDEIVEEVSVS